ncbi:MAG TPA: rhodanese-like domain-containing protein [Vicinamibacteria bacterium]|nr:rhodanese-like domain-containing protein [Vicinamibacteria bacterium]
MKLALRALLIVAAGTGLGLSWNQLSGRGFALDRNVLVKDGDQIVEAAAARQRLEKGALFLDARPVEFYEMAHIPGALPLPEEEFDGAFARLEPRLRESLEVIVYCAGFGCEASHIVARKLKERGIPAAILHEGWPAWEDAGYPVRAGRAP